MKCNYHTHTLYCDGADTPEELVLSALSKGFSALGFSGHSYLPQDADCSMTPLKEACYLEEITRLRKKYQGKITLFCGIEQDYFSLPPAYHYDFLIGSVHYVKKSGVLIPVDIGAKELKEALAAYYGDDFDALAEDYFSLVADLVEKTGADIIGHFDLVSKYSEANGYGETSRYLAAAAAAVRRLAPFNKPFEVNTGAMARGVRSVPYPSPAILSMIYKEGGKVLLSSDCHNAKDLDYGFNEALSLLKSIGFRERSVLTKDGFRSIPI